MKSRLIILFVLSSLKVFSQNCEVKEAESYLNRLFVNGKYISYDSSVFYGFDKKIKTEEPPVLARLLPNYCFFSTAFYSHQMEYSNVETLITHSENKGAATQLTHSLLYTDASRSFLHLFYNLNAKDSAEAIEVAKEVSNLFSSIIHKGHIGRLVKMHTTNVVTFELWSDDLSWRILNFYFDSSYHLKSIVIEKGVGRGKISEGYNRL